LKAASDARAAREAAAAARVVRLGVFGAQGSFSEEAGLAYAAREGLGCELGHASDPDELFRAVEEGRLDLAVLPIANSLGGLVRRSFEVLGRHSFEPHGQITLPIRHCLLARPGVEASAVTLVASHPQAFLQCGDFLRSRLPGVEARPWSDTASAARDLARGVLPPTAAVLASQRAARRFGLAVLAEGVQDARDNRTTFLVFGRGAR